MSPLPLFREIKNVLVLRALDVLEDFLHLAESRHEQRYYAGDDQSKKPADTLARRTRRRHKEDRHDLPEDQERRDRHDDARYNEQRVEQDLVPWQTADDLAGLAVNEDGVRLALVSESYEPRREHRIDHVAVEPYGRAFTEDTLIAGTVNAVQGFFFEILVRPAQSSTP